MLFIRYDVAVSPDITPSDICTPINPISIAPQAFKGNKAFIGADVESHI